MGKKGKGKKGANSAPAAAQPAQLSTAPDTTPAEGSTHNVDVAAEPVARDGHTAAKQAPAEAAESSVESKQPAALQQSQGAPLGDNQHIENGLTVVKDDQAAAEKPVAITLAVAET
eukprot:TRINITY_DN54964_c0_g1_i1.p2 TRINITY_DN54964_c0_g1~~TRINITY_DN54964_c0_g1_i1.p2  ORF type:complete len:116 (+),score=24.78 TRINITY_DN54964_c0_g1_i1:154-501(+)